MTASDDAAPDPELIAQLRGQFQPADASRKERVAQRLAASVGGLVLREAPATPRTTDATGGWARLGLAARGPALGLSFLLGAASGVGVYAAVKRTEAPRIVYRDRPAQSTPAVLSAAPTIPASPQPAPATAARPASVAAAGATFEHGLTASLGEQQALLDVARKAFASDDYSATLAALKAHFRRFPKSALAEERDALEIKALAASGRAAHAQELALRFRDRYPQSLLLPSVNDSLQPNP